MSWLCGDVNKAYRSISVARNHISPKMLLILEVKYVFKYPTLVEYHINK